RAAVRAARADLFPAVTAGASATQTHVSENRSTIQRGVGTGTFTDYQIPVDFSYEADIWGRVRRTVEASRATAAATEADLHTMLLSTQAELVSDYFQLHGVDAQRRILE